MEVLNSTCLNNNTVMAVLTSMCLNNNTTMEVLNNTKLSPNISNAYDSAVTPYTRLLVLVMLLFALFITVVNGCILICLLMSKHALKNFINVQILSLSITDMAVGILAIPVTLTLKIMSAFPYTEICAGIFYLYTVAQSANLFHALGICVHRLLAIKRQTRNKNNGYSKHKFKWLLCEILLIWIASAVILAIPFAVYGDFGERLLTTCSINAIFGENYKKGVSFMSGTFFMSQISMTVIYIYMFRFLLTTWHRPNVNSDHSQRRKDIKESESISFKKDTSTTTNATTSDSRRGLSATTSSYSTLDDKSTQVNLLVAPSTALPPITNIDKNKTDQMYDARSNKRGLDLSLNISSGSNLNEVDPVTTERRNSHSSNVADQHSDIITKPELILNEGERGEDTISFLHTSSTQQPLSDANARRFKRQRDVLVTIGIILLVTNIALTPFNVLLFFEIVSDVSVDRKIRFGAVCLSLMNSALNPFIYACRIQPFKEAFKDNVDRFVSHFRP